jgi:hypothetical protein
MAERQKSTMTILGPIPIPEKGIKGEAIDRHEVTVRFTQEEAENFAGNIGLDSWSKSKGYRGPAIKVIMRLGLAQIAAKMKEGYGWNWITDKHGVPVDAELILKEKKAPKSPKKVEMPSESTKVEVKV